jgi:hypothetical protein
MNWTDFKMRFWLGVIGRPSFSKAYEIWPTNHFNVEAPYKPYFCEPTKKDTLINGTNFSRIDNALQHAEKLLSREFDRQVLPHRRNPKCVIRIATDVEFSRVNTEGFSARGVTLKYPLSCSILVKSLDKVVIGHEILHFAEWRLGLKTSEMFVYSHEQEVADLLDI